MTYTAWNPSRHPRSLSACCCKVRVSESAMVSLPSHSDTCSFQVVGPRHSLPGFLSHLLREAGLQRQRLVRPTALAYGSATLFRAHLLGKDLQTISVGV